MFFIMHVCVRDLKKRVKWAKVLLDWVNFMVYVLMYILSYIYMCIHIWMYAQMLIYVHLL